MHQKVRVLKKSRCDVKVQVIGVRRGGKTTKIHTIVDALGNSLRFMLTRGHVHDSKVATDMLGAINLNGVNVIADKAYGTSDLREYIESNSGNYTIPPKSNILQKWDCDYYLYRE